MRCEPSKKNRILLFDDEEDVRELCTLILRHRGYEVVTRASSSAVLEDVEQEHPDLILMDNWIPGVGGIKATQEIKSHPKFQHIPVIMLSANAELSLLARQAGADSYLPKPFEITALESIIQNALRQSGAAAA